MNTPLVFRIRVALRLAGPVQRGRVARLPRWRMLRSEPHQKSVRSLSSGRPERYFRWLLRIAAIGLDIISEFLLTILRHSMPIASTVVSRLSPIHF
jgi:hypothetical protein